MNLTCNGTRKALALALAALFAIIVAFTCMPTQAYALNTAKCTARPNADTGSDVLGGVETRITWEGQAAADEQISSISLTLPNDTQFTTDGAKLTILTGADLMTRVSAKTTFSSDGETITATLDDPADAGVYYRIEIYSVEFPVSGGDMQLTGTYTLADGTTQSISDIPVITVTGTSPSEALANHLEEQDWVKSWNSNKFLRLFFNPPILVSSFPVVFQGFLLALAIVLISFPLAIPFGLILAFMRISRFKVLRGLASLYVNVVRGTPTFLQIYIAFFGLPLAGIQVPSFPLGIIVLALNSAAYQCEIYRAGIQSINKGQFEASRSLGMTGAQTMLFVIIPQTVRRVLPTLTNEWILLYKDTSLLAAVGVMEVVMYAKTIVASTGSITPYIVAALFYLVITLPLAKLVGILENKLAGNDSGTSVKKDKKSKKDKGAKKAAKAERKAESHEGVVERKLEGPDTPADASPDVSPERFSSM